MESRFNKYKNDDKIVSSQIANINSFIDWNYTDGLNIIETEIKSLKTQINEGANNKMFPKKIKQLISLGECIEMIHDTYHFNKDSKDN